MTEFSPQAPQTFTLQIEGMSCASCSARLTKRLSALDGVRTAEVNLATKRARVTADVGLRLEDLEQSVEKAGFTPVLPVTELAVSDMTCASCVGRVERALMAVAGVKSARVNLATQRVRVEGAAPSEALIAALAKAGYAARRLERGQAALDTERARQAEEEARLKRDTWLACALALPVFILEMGGHVFPRFHHLIAETIGQQTSWVIQFILTTVLLLGPGLRFYRHGLPALWRGAPDMNSLVAVGTLAAWSVSSLATFAPHLLPPGTQHVYFEAASVIVALVLLGRLLEHKARGRSSEAVKALVGLKAQTALVKENGAWIERPLDEISPGAILALRPGERVALDGVVVEGESYIDESMLTGEPIPLLKRAGDLVTGGTLNGRGTLSFRATAVGEETLLSRIIAMVEEAQSAKLPVQRLADQITLWFVPAVFAVALVTFGIWLFWGPAPQLNYALVNAVAVLIIACPCAMGLATPVSVLIATGRAAALGVLLRKGEALQAMETLRVVAFDKTGTLTEGKPQLTDFQLSPAFERAQVLALAAAVEARSEHPIATAIVEAAQAEGLTIAEAEQVEALTGKGVSGRVEGQQITLGAEKLMMENGLDISPFALEAERLGQEGKSPLYIAIDGQLAGMIVVADPPRESSASAIAALKALGLTVAMITGDNRHTAQAIARQMGIDEVVAEVLPDGKVEAITALRARFGAVAFVGDGINDAPALAAAEVGFAVGSGSDIALEAADVVMIAGGVQSVPTALRLSRQTMRNIRQNLAWAFGYNIALIPVAAGILYPFGGGLLSPMLAAGAMALSSVLVMLNAQRLRRAG